MGSMESDNQTAESGLARIEQPEAETPLAKLLESQSMAAGAYSKNTVRAQKADGAIFQAFCEGRGLAFFPAEPKTIRAFVEHCVEIGKKPATTRRYVATISRAHVAAGLSSPAASEPVRLALKEMGQKTSARQDQALAWGWKEIKEFIDSAGEAFVLDERRRCCVWRMTRWLGGANL
jgi:site-specific recombinase XerD